MIEERQVTGQPRVSVTFSDGYEDNLVLDKFYSNDEERMANKEHCNFIGHLEKDTGACVAMTGCYGSEDVHLTIVSKHAGRSAMFTWKKDGTVESVTRKVSTYIPRAVGTGWAQGHLPTQYFKLLVLVPTNFIVIIWTLLSECPPNI